MLTELGLFVSSATTRYDAVDGFKYTSIFDRPLSAGCQPPFSVYTAARDAH
jgi:hypothetical protein